MKLLCTLPSRQHFQSLSAPEGRYRWRDVATEQLLIDSNLPNPWLFLWVSVLLGTQRNSQKTPYKFVIRVFSSSSDNLPKAQILREEYQSKFAMAGRPTIESVHFDCRDSQGFPFHLAYLFVPIAGEVL